MGDVLLQILWVAAHHGLRWHGARNSIPAEVRRACWRDVHDLTAALGNPPAPGGPR